MKYQTQIWLKCTEEMYWPDENDEVFAVIAYETGGEIHFATQRQCPYGWNVLISIGAKILFIDKPTF